MTRHEITEALRFEAARLEAQAAIVSGAMKRDFLRGAEAMRAALEIVEAQK